MSGSGGEKIASIADVIGCLTQKSEIHKHRVCGFDR
jgi:hypothetical protein